MRKLNTDYVDIYYAHTDDPTTPLEETMTAFDSLVKKGKVRVLGGSNYDVWRFSDANLIAKEKNITPFTVMQQRFSYLGVRSDMPSPYKFNEYVSRERLRYLADRKIPLVTYSCLAKGGYADQSRLPKDYVTGNRLDVLNKLANEKNVTATQLVIAWLLNLYRMPDYPTVIPLFASSKATRFIENMQGAEIQLTDEEMELLTYAKG
ncbi:MAG: aldo/keto reductase [Clostridia bacterium]|nr:aldo/keto reductase [Clostridia bacterium]